MESNASSSEECQPLSSGELGVYDDVNWWFEGLLQCCVGSVGFLANVCNRHVRSQPLSLLG